MGRLRLGVGHASTVRPDPSTLGVVGERGSHHESCLQLVPGSAGQASTRRPAGWSEMNDVIWRLDIASSPSYHLATRIIRE